MEVVAQRAQDDRRSRRIRRLVIAPALRLLAGLWLFGAGLALMVRANLGLSPWDVLHDAISSLSPLSFGQAVIAVSVLVLAVAVALRVRPGAGTVANALLVGAFTDAMLQLRLLANLTSASLPPRVMAMMLGICGIALGTALYNAAGWGAGPRDALMLGVAGRARRSVGTARAAIEASVLILGLALGGSVGFGTVAFVMLIGPSINISFRLVGMEAREAETSER